MNTIKFICEFFFTDFWHWLGLVIVLCVLLRFGLITINIGNKNKEEQQ